MHQLTGLVALGLLAVANASPTAGNCTAVVVNSTPPPLARCGVDGTLTTPSPIVAPNSATTAAECAQVCINTLGCRSFGLVNADGIVCELYSRDLIKQGFRKSTNGTGLYYNHRCYKCSSTEQESYTFQTNGLSVPASNSAYYTVYDTAGMYAYELHFQPDGNIVVYQRPANAAGPLTHVWASYDTTTNAGLGSSYCTPGDASKCLFVFQGDGNLVSYANPPGSGNTPLTVLFNAQTYGNPSATLLYQAQLPYLQVISGGNTIFSSGNTNIKA